MDISQDIIGCRAVVVIIEVPDGVGRTVKIRGVHSLCVFYRNDGRSGQRGQYRTAMLGGSALRNGGSIGTVVADMRTHAQPIIHTLVQLEIDGIAFEIGAMYDPVLVEIAHAQQPGAFRRSARKGSIG